MAASLSLSSYSASLGTTITATASGLTVGTMYEITVSTSSSSKYWKATSSSFTWSFTPTTTGYTTFYLYEAGKQVASRSVMITSGGGSGGGGDSGDDDDLTDGPCNCSSWVFQRNAIGKVIERTSDGWATIQFTVYVDNEEYFETRGRLTGTTVSSGGTSTEVGRTSNINIDGYDTGSFTFTVSNWYWDNNTTSKQFTLVSDWSIYLYASDTSQGMQTECTSKIMYATVNYTPAVQYDDFFWADGTTTISSGDTFTDKIDASTWLDLISKVNKLKGTNISTSGVQSGQKFTATHYNNVANALGVKTVSSGADCNASLFNALRNAYRSQAGLT